MNEKNRLAGMAPIVSPRTVVLVLGSFPGVKSLALGQYYAHPQNHFWKILQAIWPSHPLSPATEPFAARADWLLERGLGVWDVYAACEREGSLDSAIRDAAVNDFASLDLPRLGAIAHNGAESFRHSQRVVDALAPARSDAVPLPVYKLPSTSPANASWSFDRKLDAWRDVFVRHGIA
jgi:hypoxanthine-DNA glycosylase